MTILSYKLSGNQWKESFETENNLGGSDEHFLFVSPFATWSMIFENDDGVDLGRANEIRLAFKARAVPANSRVGYEMRQAIPH